MSILNDATIEEITENSAEDLLNDLDDAQDPQQQQQNNYGLPHFDFGFLKSPTGNGTIEDYLQHVLNPEHSKGIAQILRGCTGLAGNLNLAVLDILFGIFGYLKENKTAAAAKVQKKEETKINEKPIINV